MHNKTEELENALRGAEVLLMALVKIYGTNGVLHIPFNTIGSIGETGKVGIHRDVINQFVTLKYQDDSVNV